MGLLTRAITFGMMIAALGVVIALLPTAPLLSADFHNNF